MLDAATNLDALAATARNGEVVRQKFEQTAQTRKLEDYYLETMASSEARLN